MAKNQNEPWKNGVQIQAWCRPHADFPNIAMVEIKCWPVPTELAEGIGHVARDAINKFLTEQKITIGTFDIIARVDPNTPIQ